jgi:DNA-binding GntR family transcriptional regulator
MAALGRVDGVDRGGGGPAGGGAPAASGDGAASGYRTKAALAFEFLKRRISTGAFRPGAPLRQRALAREIGVSLTPVREAIRRLQAEGYLAGEAHRTLRVKDATAEEVREVYAIRAVLEGYAAGLASARLGAADVRDLAALLDEMSGVAGHGWTRRYRALDEQFHMRLYAAAGNRLLHTMIGDLWRRYPRDVLWTVPGRLRHSVREHRAILAALRAANVRRAEALMRRHIETSMDEVLSYVQVRPAAAGGVMSREPQAAPDRPPHRARRSVRA